MTTDQGQGELVALNGNERATEHLVSSFGRHFAGLQPALG